MTGEVSGCVGDASPEADSPGGRPRKTPRCILWPLHNWWSCSIKGIPSKHTFLPCGVPCV